MTDLRVRPASGVTPYPCSRAGGYGRIMDREPAVLSSVPGDIATHLRELVVLHGDSEALVCGRERRTYSELDAESDAIAHALVSSGVVAADRVAFAGDNAVATVATVLACWKIGAVPFPYSRTLPEPEFEALIELARPAIVIGPRGVDLEDLLAAIDGTPDPLPAAVCDTWKIMGTGGSTGRPKLIVDSAEQPRHAVTAARALGLRAGSTQLIAGPLYHNGPFAFTLFHILVGGRVVLMERFDERGFLDLLEQEHVGFAMVVPTMLHRIFSLDASVLDGRDLSALEAILHTAAACPPWLKERAIDYFGAERVYELYGATEAGSTVIRGDEWLVRRGSVGRPGDNLEIRILDERGATAATGEVGEIWLRERTGPRVSYIGGELRTRDGFVSVGDLGWVDGDGYLYIADRRSDLIVSGGANIYPAEVEGALLEHPEVRDAVVIGLPNPEWGQTVHAIVARDGGATDADLDQHCRQRLVAYKVPRSWEFVEALPRDDSGKIRRSALRDERVVTS